MLTSINKKKLLLIFLGLIFIVTIDIIRPRFDPIPQKYCQPAGGDIYCIPVEYFSLPPIDPTGFGITINYPAMTPGGDKVPRMLITVQDTHKYGRSDDVIELLRTQNPITDTVRYGLREAPSRLKPGIRDIFYEPNTDPFGSQPSAISCEIEDSTLPPPQNIMCTHRFVSGSVAINITYLKNSLANWATIKADVLTFIESFKQ
ncbi:MAG: hypothetical protein J0L77_00310 [Alphaproteobacteria bacterium]|nr:hypothetical protein [Alphaproteobacteria bacterium]